MDSRTERLSDAELHAFFDRLFPEGFDGVDVRAEVAPNGWEQSQLVACFHPSVERVFEERLQFHQNIAALRIAGSRRTGQAQVETETSPAPTLEEVQREYKPEPVQADAELTELVGLCLWDVFSDNHDVITDDGRVADIGSFRGAGAFLDEYLTHNHEGWRKGDYLRFYLGTIWINARADLAPMYAMIFRRIRELGGDWVYHFPELGLVDFSGLRPDSDSLARYSPNEALAAERKAHKREAEIARLREDLEEINTRAREDAMDRLPPAHRPRLPSGLRTRSQGLATRIAGLAAYVTRCHPGGNCQTRSGWRGSRPRRAVSRSWHESAGALAIFA